MKKIIMILSLSLALLSGCKDANLEKNLPIAKFSVGSLQINAVTGSYTWAEDGETDQKDKGKPVELAKNSKPVEVAEADSIKLAFSKEPTSLQAGFLDEASGEAELKDVTEGVFMVPSLPEGKHTVVVKANFPNGNADFIFTVNAIELEEVVTNFAYPQLLPEERHTYSMLAVGVHDEKTPLETNEKVIQYVNEILSLPTVKQVKLIYPELDMTAEPSFVLFDQKGPVFQSANIEELISFIDSNKP
ncbi:hypothetical protein A8F94_21835 [Bacillus sp. FJAT-27225]|uniref:hypothetical protein n=1 Tax=Bacillus sp. FJAT-27225 TaxID=1743144 RepID=UPI00080C339C|nr:hypothetical protein [Bacillus sp. FJAT-27225]OCA81520.1 hypothetical protein A8F94_21835 [Bacillus sp. FJAT-27225]